MMLNSQPIGRAVIKNIALSLSFGNVRLLHKNMNIKYRKHVRDGEIQDCFCLLLYTHTHTHTHAHTHAHTVPLCKSQRS